MTPPTLIDRADLRRCGIKLHNSTLLRLEKRGQFPRRVKVGGSTYWISEEIEEWIASLKEAR